MVHIPKNISFSVSSVTSIPLIVASISIVALESRPTIAAIKNPPFKMKKSWYLETDTLSNSLSKMKFCIFMLAVYNIYLCSHYYHLTFLYLDSIMCTLSPHIKGLARIAAPMPCPSRHYLQAATLCIFS